MEKTANDVKGRLMISEDVISAIAVNAVKDIEAVQEIRSQPRSVIDIISNKPAGQQVKVGYVDDVVEIGIKISVKSTAKATAVAEQVQEKVKSAVQEMTGLTVARVNVTVDDIVFDQ